MRRIKINQNTKYYIIFIVLALFAKNGYYLWGDNDYIIDGLLKYADIGLLLALFFTLCVGMKYGFGFNSGRYDYFILGYIVLSIVSTFSAYMLFDQSLLRGLFAQRVQLFWFVSYFFIRRLLQLRKMNVESLIKILYVMALIELSICTVQYLVGDNMFFLAVKSELRNYVRRYYFNVSFLIPISLFALYQLLHNRKNRILNGIIVVWTALLIAVFSQYRSVTVYYAIGCLIIVLFWNRSIFKRILLLTLAAIVAYLVLKDTSMFKMLLQALRGGIFNDANMLVRNTAREHYFSELGKTAITIITGRGYPSVSNYGAFSAAGFYNYMYFTDNGIFGFLYCYGLLGLVWYMFFWIKMIRDSWQIRRYTSVYFAYLLYYVVGFINDFSWFWSANFIFIVMICFLEATYNEKKYLR